MTQDQGYRGNDTETQQHSTFDIYNTHPFIDHVMYSNQTPFHRW